MNHPPHLEVEAPDGHHRIILPAGEQQVVLTEALRRGNMPLNTRCGQRGLCNGCTVELVHGEVRHVATGVLQQADETPLLLHACQYEVVTGAATAQAVHIRVPARSLLAYEPQVVTNFRLNIPRADEPLWQCLEVVPDGIEDCRDLSMTVGRRLDTPVPVNLESRFLTPEYSLPDANPLFVTVEYQGSHWLITEIAATAAKPKYGVAIDIGTTTVALLLVELGSGYVVAQSGGFNRQMQMGDDVLTRINLCLTDPKIIPQMQDAVARQTITPLLHEALSEAGATADQIACLSIAGNSTMLHLLAGVDPSPMGIAPFTPTFLEHRVLRASEIGLAIDGADPAVHLLPGAAAYVGADLCAGILASGLIYDDGPSLLVDVGTNGEIVLKYNERLFGCATAAGPAFEGAGLTCGMRAGDGAISRINLGNAAPDKAMPVDIEVISKGARHRPAGICGSAYIDFLAEGRSSGLLSTSGRFDRNLAGVAQHLIESPDFGLGFRVARGQGKRDIVIGEMDIARLLQAKAAIAAGILTLLEREGIAPGEIKTLYLAGGFGLHLDLASAIGSGLLPEFEPEQVQVVGNTSLAGAYLALLDSSTLDEMERVRQQMEIIELNLDPDFESRYIDQLILP